MVMTRRFGIPERTLHAGNKRFCYRMPDDNSLHCPLSAFFHRLQADAFFRDSLCDHCRNCLGDNSTGQNCQALHYREVTAGGIRLRGAPGWQLREPRLNREFQRHRMQQGHDALDCGVVLLLVRCAYSLRQKSGRTPRANSLLINYFFQVIKPGCCSGPSGVKCNMRNRSY
jgi:hypothetical protein